MKLDYERIKDQMKIMQDRMEKHAGIVRAAEDFLLHDGKGYHVVGKGKEARSGGRKAAVGQKVGKVATSKVKEWKKMEDGSSKPISKEAEIVVQKDQVMEDEAAAKKVKRNPPII